MTFKELGLSETILKAIQELGFENPMPVQAAVIPEILQTDDDVVGLAQTGTGKTAAFGLPLIQQTDISNKKTQVLILSPTRELCVQIHKDLSAYSKYMHNLKVLAVYGGANIEPQIRDLKKGVQIIVATPGRLIDLMERGAAKLNSIKSLVLDEADEMLSMGFSDSINQILENIPDNRNIYLFSATMPPEIRKIAGKYMTNPKEIVIGTKNAGSENVTHYCYTVHSKEKYLALKRIVDFYPSVYGIVFCRTRAETKDIAEKLIQDGYNADSLHGDLSQAQRDTVMQKFRLRNIQLLIATDVAARGLDVNDLTHVIHFSLPDDIEVYTHRSGRTGRIGKSGMSIAITHLREKHQLKRIEKSIKNKFIISKVPSGRQICEKQLFNLINKMENVGIENSEIDTYLPVIYKKLDWLSKEELIKRFVSLEFNRFLDYYRYAPEISDPEAEKAFTRKKSSKRNKDGSAEEGYTRIFLNLGKSDGIVPGSLIEIINRNTPGQKIEIGRIDLMKSFSFFEVRSDQSKSLIKALNNDVFYRKIKVKVEEAMQKNSRKDRKQNVKSKSKPKRRKRNN